MMKNSQLDIREIRQREAAESHSSQGIIAAAPRFGKIKTTIEILKKHENPKKVLICYPENPIKDSWVNDFQKWNYQPEEVIYVNFSSLHKHILEDVDFLIVDEIHLASEKQLHYIGDFTNRKVKTVALSGTLTETKKKEIFYTTGLVVIYDYSIEQAVKEGVLTDYVIHVHKIPLSSKLCGRYKDKLHHVISEKKKFENYYWVWKNKKFLRNQMERNMISLLQSSLSKHEKTVELLQRFQNQRVIVFCGLTEIADSFDIPSYHSKTKDKDLFRNFCAGEGDHIALVNMGSTGTTISKINKGIINYNTGSPADFTQRICRFLGREIEWPDKKAELHYIVSDEKFELMRLSTCTMWFDEKKIIYV